MSTNLDFEEIARMLNDVADSVRELAGYVSTGEVAGTEDGAGSGEGPESSGDDHEPGTSTLAKKVVPTNDHDPGTMTINIHVHR